MIDNYHNRTLIFLCNSGKEIMDYELHVGWGKAVPVPPHPIYIPAHLRADNKNIPPPPTGLPFNAQVNKIKDDQNYAKIPPPGENQADMPLDSQSDNVICDFMIRYIIFSQVTYSAVVITFMIS